MKAKPIATPRGKEPNSACRKRFTRLLPVPNVSTATLMELYQLLNDSSDRSHVVEIQKELVASARAQGLTNRDILAALVSGVGKKSDRAAIASA